MSVRTSRTRLFAATAIALVALTTLTACEDGQGVRDEGPSTTSARHETAPEPPTTHNIRAASMAQ
ncbi:hypothetical protein ACFYXF_23560 [Streptomyces sp. NPDC002680]|uniref:hypothetical protein n=1 Tax=Streptomyces sp. NPDC002680 TaxID=3364659 RepID=UPI0036CC29C0